MWGDFLRSALLIALTAGLTGLLIPLITKSVDERRRKEREAAEEARLRERAEFEATLARQGKVIDSQASLLDRFSELIATFRLTLLAVPYYRQFPSASSQYQQATERYLSSSGEQLGKIRGEISKSLRLVPSETYEQLLGLYHERLLVYDLRLTQLIDAEPGGNTREWRNLLNEGREVLDSEIDAAIDSLARSCGLSWSMKEPRA